MKPFVSVVIPVLNDAVRLRTCLEALGRQTYPADAFEVIVVDNGSDSMGHGAWGMADSKLLAPSSLRLLVEPKRSSYAARNAGIKAAKGEILAFTDADCIPAADWIEKGVKALDSDKPCGLVGGRVELTFGDPARPNAVELFESVFAFDQENYIQKYHFAVTANLFTTRAVIEKVGMFDSSLLSGGDQEWGQKVYSAGYKPEYVPDAIVRHPARNSLRALLVKHRRVKGGFYDNKRKKGPYSFKEFLIDLKDDWPQARAFSEISSNKEIPPFKKLKLTVLLILVRTVRFFEMVRLKFDGKSQWR